MCMTLTIKENYRIGTEITTVTFSMMFTTNGAYKIAQALTAEAYIAYRLWPNKEEKENAATTDTKQQTKTEKRKKNRQPKDKETPANKSN